MDEDRAHTIDADVAELAGAVAGDPAHPAPRIETVWPDGEPVAASAFDVDRLLASTAAFATGELAALPGSLVDQRTIDVAHLLAWCTSTVLVDGVPLPAWADLSGVYRTADDRHLQLHCNFPHHAAGVLDHLGVAADRDVLAAAIEERDAAELETELIERGMIAALVRTLDEWDAHPHAAATAALPIVTVERIGDAPPGDRSDASGVRVVDQSRVLAGPVAGHLLASAGCDVLRVGAAHLPSVAIGVVSTGFGKRNTDLDLRTPTGREAADRLLGGADVWLDGYRPGSLASFGLTPERVAERRPGIVIVEISAFDAPIDTSGPWAGRRGYDSIVQSTTGVRWAGGAYAERDDGSSDPTPLGLPVQALDHATGFLAAGVAARLLAHQRVAGGSWRARLSLLRTRNRLVGLREPRPHVPRPVEVASAHLASIEAPVGRVEAVRPFAGRWTGPPLPLGSSPPTWR